MVVRERLLLALGALSKSSLASPEEFRVINYKSPTGKKKENFLVTCPLDMYLILMSFDDKQGS